MRLTRRGKIVIVILAIIALYGFYELVNHIWWVGDRWCFGTAQKCLGL